MLYDKKWDVDEIGRVMLAAADYMEKHGWCRGHMKNDKGKVCLAGAINSISPEAFIVSNDFKNRLNNFCKFPSGFMYWNDKFCRDKAEAVAMLRAAAFAK